VNWFTWKRIGILGGIGSAIFFAGFSICKLAGSEPHVSWREGLFDALAFGTFVILCIVFRNAKAAVIGKMFYGE